MRTSSSISSYPANIILVPTAVISPLDDLSIMQEKEITFSIAASKSWMQCDAVRRA